MVQNRDYSPLVNDKLTTTDYARQDNRMDKRLATHSHSHKMNAGVSVHNRHTWK
jgi:hypothetical protein